MTQMFNSMGDLILKMFITMLGITVLGGIIFVLFIIINSL